MSEHAKLETYGIDPVGLSDRDNEKLGDIMEDNDRLTVENRQLRSQLGQLQNQEAPLSASNTADSRGQMSDDVKQEMAKMEDELARLMAENADLKTGVRPSPPLPPPRESTPPQSLSTGASVRSRSSGGGGGLFGGSNRLQSQASSASVASSFTEMEAEYDQLMIDHKVALEQVTFLEDQLDSLHAAANPHGNDGALQLANEAAAAANAAAEEAERKLAESRTEGAELKRQLAASHEELSHLQSQVSTKHMLGRVGSDAEVAQSDALVHEILQLQRSKSTSLGSAAAAAAETANATVDGDAADKERAVALSTLEGLTKQNRQLSKKVEESAARVQAASQRVTSLQDSKAALERETESLRSQLVAKAKSESGRVINKLLAKLEALKTDRNRSAEQSSALSYSVKLLQDQLAAAEAAVVDRDRLATQLDNMKQEMRQLAALKKSSGDEEELRQAWEEVDKAQLDASRVREELEVAVTRASKLEVTIADLQTSRDESSTENTRLRQALERATQDAQQLSDMQQKMKGDNKMLQESLATAEEKARHVADENKGLLAQLARLDGALGQGSSSSADVALLKELQLENDKLETENQRISHTAKELLADKADLLNRLTNVAMESSFAGGSSGTPTPRHVQLQLSGGRFRSFSEVPALAEGDRMSLPGSPVANDSHRRSLSNTHTTPPNLARRSGLGAATPLASQPRGRTATQALQALFSQIDDQEGPADDVTTADEGAGVANGKGGANDGSAAVSTPTHEPSPHSQGDLDPTMLRQKHAAQADALAAAGATPEDAARRAALKKRSDSLLRSFNEGKVEEAVRAAEAESSHSRAGLEAHSAARAANGEGSFQGLLHRVSLEPPPPTTTGVVSDGKARPALSLQEASDASAVAAAAAAFGKKSLPPGFNPELGASRRMLSESSTRRALPQPSSPAGSASSEQSAAPSHFSSRSISTRSDAHGEGNPAATAAATAAAMSGLDRPPRPQGHSRTTSASESVSSLADCPPGSARVGRRESFLQSTSDIGSGRPAHEGKAGEGARAQHDRRSLQEAERAARLHQWAETKVNAAYFRYVGGADSAPDVAAFMRALGWSFRGDPGGEAGREGALFDTALAITHPSRGRSGSTKDKAVAAAAHAKLQNWRKLALA